MDTSFETLAKTDYTYADMLRYYKNIWNRNLIARCIDVQTDVTLKAEDPEQIVQHENQNMPVKERLEHRKIIVQDAITLLEGINALLALTPEELEKHSLSKEALAVAQDMLPPKDVAGNICTTADGKPGILTDNGKGGLDCVAPAEPAPQATEEAAPTPPGAEESKGDNPSAEAQV